MNDYPYILEPYKGMNTRYRCPGCSKGKTFSLYIDRKTGEHVAPSVGRCNRESNCGYHYSPKQYFQDNNISFDTPQAYNKPKVVNPQPVSFIPVEVLKASLKGYETNHFVTFLISLFGIDIASGLISRYFIATSKHWEGATVFWQIDTQGKVRTGKIMLYSPTTGKRVKEPFNHITWAHKFIEQPEFELKQCLFGEHLLVDKTKPVAIVESEKTAVIASVYLPQFIWLAAGSLTNLNAEKCSILKGRTATLFPDLNGFEKWSSKAKELSHLAKFTVSDLLERKTTETEKKQGFDLADYLIKMDWRKFRTQPIEKAEQKLPEVLPQPGHENHEAPERNYFLQLDKNLLWDIDGLETFFAGAKLPIEPVKMNPYSTVTDIQKFIQSHIAIAKNNNGNPTFQPYFDRLESWQLLITDGGNGYPVMWDKPHILNTGTPPETKN